jgi:HlyD family secretion protein
VALAGAAAVIASRRPMEVDVAAVRTGALRVTVDEAGTTRVRRHTDVSSPITGRFVPSGLRVGDSVGAGSVVGLVHPAPLDRAAQDQARARLGAVEAAQRQAETRVQVARGASDDAARTLSRLERVAQAGGVSAQELERVRTAAEAAASDLEAARQRERESAFEFQSARSVVASFEAGARDAIRVVASRSGRVLHLYEEHERVVTAGTPLVQVADPGDLELVIPVLSGDATRVKPGAEVRFTAGAQGDTLVGRVMLVEPSAFTKVSALGVEEQRVNVVASVPRAAGRLGDQYRVDARITVWESSGVTLVPPGALVRDGNAWSVFAVERGRARRKTVQLGERGTDAVEVREGLKPGEQVVVYPGDRVADGASVRTRSR